MSTRTLPSQQTLLRSLTIAMMMVVAAFFVIPSSAAEAGNWTWKKYRLKFWLPTGIKATTTNSREFVAKGKGIVLKIRPWKSSRSTSRSAAKYGYNTYGIIAGKRVLYTKRLRKAGAWVHVIVGSGFVGRKRVYFAVMGLAGKRSANNFYVRMWWPKWRHKWVKPRVNNIAGSLYVY